MNSRDVKAFDPRVVTAILNQYVYLRQFLWSSIQGQFQSFYRDDATTKMTDCSDINKEFYNTDKSSLADKFKLCGSYLIYIENNDPAIWEQQTQKIIEHQMLKNAFLFIANAKDELYCITVENGSAKKNEEEIKIKKESQLILPELIAKLGEMPKQNEWHKLSKDKVNLILTNTHHNQSKLLKAWIKTIYKLGEASLEQSFLSDSRHAVRTYIIAKIKESELENEFKSYIEKKRSKSDRTRKEIDVMQESIIQIKADHKRKEDVLAAEEELAKKITAYHKNLRKLSHLGDLISILRANKEGLFSKLIWPDLKKLHLSLNLASTINMYIPFVYHENYHLFLHKMNCYKLKQIQHCDPEFTKHVIKYEDFEKNAGTFPTVIITPNRDSYLHQATSSVTTTVNVVCSGIGTMIKFTGWHNNGPKPANHSDSLLKNNTTINPII